MKTQSKENSYLCKSNNVHNRNNNNKNNNNDNIRVENPSPEETSQNNSNLNNNIKSKTINISNKKHTRFLQDKSNRLKLFLLQDDRTNIQQNPLLYSTPVKAPLPKFHKRKTISQSANEKHKLKREKELKEISQRSPQEQKEHIININKELIKELNAQMSTFTNQNMKNPFWYNLYRPNNKKISNKQSLKQMSSVFNQTNLIQENNNNKIEVIERIKELSPGIVEKKIINQKRIPYLFRRIQSAKMGIPFETRNIYKIREKQNSMSEYYTKQKINLEEVLIMHNSTIRKSVSEFKVQDFQFKKSLKLKNTPIESAFLNNRKNKEELSSAVNGKLYL